MGNVDAILLNRTFSSQYGSRIRQSICDAAPSDNGMEVISTARSGHPAHIRGNGMTVLTLGDSHARLLTEAIPTLTSFPCSELLVAVGSGGHG